MLEVEIKAYCDSPDAVREKILVCGAAFRARYAEHDVYYNHPSRDFAVTDEALRIRCQNEKTMVTYKGPKLSACAKTRFEQETDISSFEDMTIIFEKLGFCQSGEVKKIRDEYTFGNIHICIDTVDNLGVFVELEEIGENHKRIESELFALAEKIGLYKFERRSYLEMCLEKNKQP